MWTCKHCKQDFEFSNLSDKANHSRWCNDNPKRNNWNKKQSAINKYGDYKEYKVICHTCDKEFCVSEREKIFPSKDKYFCSRNCSNSVGGIAKREKYGLIGYVTIAEKYYHKKCAVCGISDVLDVHHIDEDRTNNHPSNLIFLCPNDHYRLHRNNDETVLKIIKGHGTAWGGHFTSNEEYSRVQIPDAPPNYFK